MSEAARGVRALRRLTLGRAARGYVRWVGRAVGWWTIFYMVAWAVFLLVSGLQVLTPLDAPAAFPAGLVVSGCAAALLLLVLSTRSPPVTLSRSDLYRLALSPAPPWASLRYAFVSACVARFVVGAVLGGAWWVVSATYLLQPTPWAPLGLGLLALAQLSLGWAVYAEQGHPRGRRYGSLGAVLAAALALLGVVAPGWGLAAALMRAGAASLILPVVLAVVAFWCANRTLRERYPARFAPQCLVLNELCAMRTLSVIATLSSIGTGVNLSAGAEPGERARLLAQLRDTPGSTTPTRTLPPPAAADGLWRLFAWRTALGLYRQPVWFQGWLLLLLGASGLALRLSSGSLLLLTLAALLTSVSASLLLGPALGNRTLPVLESARTLGRVVPGLLVGGAVGALVLLVATPFLPPASGTAVREAALVFPLSLVLAEKLSVWLGMSPTRVEVRLSVALLALTPGLLLRALGIPEFVVPAQMLLVFIAYVLPV